MKFFLTINQLPVHFDRRMVYCCAALCTNKSTALLHKTKNISFHKFPKDEKRRQTWVENINRENFKPSQYSMLCSAHFSTDMFERAGYKRKLKTTAVPTVFIYPKFFKQKHNEDQLLVGNIVTEYEINHGAQQSDSTKAINRCSTTEEEQSVDQADTTTFYSPKQIPEHSYYIQDSPRKIKNKLESKISQLNKKDMKSHLLPSAFQTHVNNLMPTKESAVDSSHKNVDPHSPTADRRITLESNGDLNFDYNIVKPKTDIVDVKMNIKQSEAAVEPLTMDVKIKDKIFFLKANLRKKLTIRVIKKDSRVLEITVPEENSVVLGTIVPEEDSMVLKTSVPDYTQALVTEMKKEIEFNPEMDWS